MDLAGLLGPAPLEEVLARAVARPATPPRRTGTARSVRETLPEQRSLLAAEEFTGTGTVHRISGAELSGPLDLPALNRALRALVARHEGLRTVFAWSPKGPVRRVTVRGDIQLQVQESPFEPGLDPVRATHDALRATTGKLIGGADRPPVAFVLTRFAEQHHLLSVVYHEAMADQWSVGLVWRELLTDYERAVDGRAPSESPAPSPDAALDRTTELASSGTVMTLTARRIRDLAGYPTTVELPAAGVRPASFDFRGERLTLDLSPALREACDRVALRAGVTRTAVLLGAWALTVGRQAGTEQLLIGVQTPRRPTSGLMRTVAPCSAVTPVRCELLGTVDYFLRGIACSLSEGVEFADVPLRSLSQGLGLVPDRARTPLVQIGFAALDEVLPEALSGVGGLDVRFHTGHCGGISADAELTVLHWGETPSLGLTYASSVLGRVEALALLDGLHECLQALLALHENDLLDGLGAPPAPARALAGLPS